MKRLTTVAAAFASLAAGACGPKEPAGPPVGVSDKPGDVAAAGQPVTYLFDSLDERPVSSEAMRGKPTLLAFVTTGDLQCQAEVDFLVAMAKHDSEKVNYALVALHPRREIILVDTYVRTLKVEFPVALGDASELAGAGPFGEIASVPTIVILDRDGKIAWKHSGFAKSDELRAHLRGL